MSFTFGDLIRIKSTWVNLERNEQDIRLMVLRPTVEDDPDHSVDNYYAVVLVGHDEDAIIEMEEENEEDAIFRTMTVTPMFEHAFELVT